jgi:NAD(P)-dependent dehydrogenase (short-subunit alcohol dehydrogenase family)
MNAPPSLDDVRRATQLLEHFASDRVRLTDVPEIERKAFLSAAGRLANPERDLIHRLSKRKRKKERERQREADSSARESTGIRALRQAPVFSLPPPGASLPPPQASRPKRLLERPRTCYVCKSEYRELHHFYDAMCLACGDFNFSKRTPVGDLRGQVALVTGARVKIGYQASLMLLRNGASVVATTRFPKDAAERYAREPDFEAWASRLQVFGLDLRHAPSVEVLARHLSETLPRLDILINNAAQTVRRPPGFYGHLMPSESRSISQLAAPARALLVGQNEVLARISAQRTLAADSAQTLAPSWRDADPTLGLHASAALSLVPYAFENEGDVAQLFPTGKLDADLQQVDLRTVNTWRLTLSEVATAELLEVYLVNAVAPFVLCGKLKGLMERARQRPGHIVNVSAMEGIFSRGTKTDKHPHTNMAKAALNMMTLTSAPDYAQSNIYMNAVDTGWVTDEDPAHHATRKQQELGFQPPLDIVDGAARIVDPVFAHAQTGTLMKGLFVKDYKPAAW